ncbi:hypothetical protein B0H14DRAFT_2633689 [Mycena olivaceomarginata]|nr:hypothetical protein B0H14DRAFT_2633689 [Mycena olivaceomarginata]
MPESRMWLVQLLCKLSIVVPLELPLHAAKAPQRQNPFARLEDLYLKQGSNVENMLFTSHQQFELAGLIRSNIVLLYSSARVPFSVSSVQQWNDLWFGPNTTNSESGQWALLSVFNTKYHTLQLSEDAIKREVPSAEIRGLELDLSSLSAVRKVATEHSR